MGNFKGTTKSGGRKHVFDKFYTKPEVARFLVSKTGFDGFDTVIEPSAGSGAFSRLVPGCLAFDLRPEHANIVEQDWFTYSRSRREDERVLVLGNPPFGQQNSLAVGFMNHAASFADRVAFILPASFRKTSVQARIDRRLHLVDEVTVPDHAFLLNGADYHVPCVFQIWDFNEVLRPVQGVSRSASNNLFTYVKKSENPDATVRRIGGNAGRASLNVSDRSENSNYFVKFNDLGNVSAATLVEKLNTLSFPSRNYTVGPRSISKHELDAEVNKVFK